MGKSFSSGENLKDDTEERVESIIHNEKLKFWLLPRDYLMKKISSEAHFFISMCKLQNSKRPNFQSEKHVAQKLKGEVSRLTLKTLISEKR